MAGLTSSVCALRSAVARRFSTKAARFRCALLTGFAVTALGALTLANGSVGNADDLFGRLFGGLYQPQQAYPQYASRRFAPSVRSTRRHAAHYARRRPDERKPVVKLAAAHMNAPVRLGRESMCVRLCDGFSFPVGAYHGDEDRASHEATCQSECPGADTALYVLPNGSDFIGDALEARSGRGFHYTTYVHDACSCHPKEGNRISSLLHDYTLRRGDAVMTKTGFKVFHGGVHFPFRQADFVVLAKSRDVQDGQRATFHAIERASLTSPQNAADDPKLATAPAAPAKLERQANLAP